MPDVKAILINFEYLQIQNLELTTNYAKRKTGFYEKDVLSSTCDSLFILLSVCAEEPNTYFSLTS